MEVADELLYLSIQLQHTPNLPEAEAARLRALSICESLPDVDVEEHLHILDSVTDFFLDTENDAQAAVYLLKGMEIRKEVFGPLSGELELQILAYRDTLDELGRTDEVAELDEILDEELPPEMEKIIASLEGADGEKLDESIKAIREKMSEMKAFIDTKPTLMQASHPLFALLRRARSFPLFYLKTTLARFIRMKALLEQRPEILHEAVDLSREVLAAVDHEDERVRLMLMLLELAAIEPERYEELDVLIDDSGESAATLYTRALSSFRQHGATSESKKAFREAVRYNPYVLTILASDDGFEVPDDFEPRSEGEAAAYCVEATYNWRTTPGISEFMIEVLDRTAARKS
jgi:tetratricopeptide (TPR) repeat protein